MCRRRNIGYCCMMWFIAINISLCNGQTINTTNTMSIYPNPYNSKLGIQHVLSRRKRYLLFPPGAAFVATMSFAKAIASDYPRGVNFVVETDFYYPMYSSISELFPKDKKPTTTTTPKPATVPTIPIMSAPTMESEKFDSFPGTYFDSSDFLRRQDTNEIPNYYRKEYIPLNPGYKYWQSPNSHYNMQYQSSSNYISKPIYTSPNAYPNDVIYPNKYRDLNWRQRELYRSRRDLYSHIEGMAEKHGFEITTCIQRMICEGRHYLLPPGVSFFQDVLRILLTVPVTNDIEDGYSKAMQASEDDCLSIYSEKCPYSIVGYILHNQQEANK